MTRVQRSAHAGALVERGRPDRRRAPTCTSHNAFTTGNTLATVATANTFAPTAPAATFADAFAAGNTLAVAGGDPDVVEGVRESTLAAGVCTVHAKHKKKCTGSMS